MKKRDPRMFKRGQAALEFLTTYGFAFLIILVMIGALSYFGVLSPNKLIPDRCTMPPDFNCFEFRAIRDQGASGGASMDVVVINQLGDSVDFNTAPGSYNASSQYGYADNSTAANTCTFTPLIGTVGGGKATLHCIMNSTGANFPAKGEKLKVAFDFQYRELGRQYWVPIRADILATLQ